MRREDAERLRAWEAPVALQRAIGDERAERVEKLLDPYDEPLEHRWPHERRVPRTARRRHWATRNAGKRFLGGFVALGAGAALFLQARHDAPVVAWTGAALFGTVGLALIALDARMLSRTARWFAITPTRLLLHSGRRVDVYRWEGFAPDVAVFLARGVGCLALTWRGRDGARADRVELRGVVDPEPLARALEARIRQARG